MRPIMLRLVLGLLVSFGCRTIPGQDVRYEPTPMPVVRAVELLRGPADLVTISGPGRAHPDRCATESGARGVAILFDPALVTQAQQSARGRCQDEAEFKLARSTSVRYSRDPLLPDRT